STSKTPSYTKSVSWQHHQGKALVLKIPKSRILTETDGPFAKFRNDPLMPWDSGIAEKQLAALWGISQMEVNAQLVDNFKVLCTS
ncbi:TatD family hydrolase, partial [Escherichia coli]|nr:TatD family hydrolase [Escherichia coli]